MNKDGIWLFGYGSLIWKPEIEYAHAQKAVISDFRRSFCMWSIHHRGSEEEMGLVLALDAQEGAACEGMAFYVAPEDAEKALEDVRARELISSAYREVNVPIRLEDGREVDAYVYIIQRDHVQYAVELSLEDQAQIIARAVGGMGPNDEYLHQTFAALESLDIRDEDLAWLDGRVRAIKAR